MLNHGRADFPPDIAEHLQAAFELSSRRVHLRLLEEAEGLNALNSPLAAIAVAGVVLESVLQDEKSGIAVEDQQQIAKWQRLRNRAAHADTARLSVEEAKEMIKGVRLLLTRNAQRTPHVMASQGSAAAPQQIRGKYKFVPTSSADFIKRKDEEVGLEH